MEYPEHLALVAHGNSFEGIDEESLGEALTSSRTRLAQMVEDIFTSTAIRIFSFYDILLEERIKRGLSPGIALEIRSFLTGWSLPGGVSLALMGNPRKLPQELAGVEKMWNRPQLHPGGRGILWFMGYGGREEIVEAVRLSGQRDRPGNGGDGLLASNLLTAGLPDPDLLVLTGGLRLLPDFMIYQMSYSEVYLSSKPWSAFGFRDLEKALGSYRRRERRYGRIYNPP
jgi:undecaprenyl pyrophosphate synthase